MAEPVETTDEESGQTPEQRSMQRWITEIQISSDYEKNWRKRAHRVVERYRDEKRDRTSREQFNILWSNTETLKPALYSATPKPDVRRRYRDEDELGKEVARVLERAVSFQIDTYDFDGEMNACIEDYLLPGRGIVRARYVPTMAKGEPPRVAVEAVPVLDEETQAVVREQFLVDGEEVDDPEIVQRDEMGYYLIGEAEDEVVWEEVKNEYVLWENFRQSSEPLWRDKRWIAFGTEMTRDEMVSAFGADIGNKVVLTEKRTANDRQQGDGYTPNESTEQTDGRYLQTAFVWEVWDREKKMVRFVSEGYRDGFLMEIEDPLNLMGFFPTPEPLVSVKTNDSSIPIPEFTLYQDQAEELDRITDRISKLVTALKVRGVYDGQYKEQMAGVLGNAETDAGENKLIPLDNFQQFAEKGGLDGAISWMPIEQIGKVLAGLYNQRNTLISTIYELTGISDIMRGATDPRETAKAQELKGQFGSMRIQPRQRLVQRYCRDLFRINAEIIAEMFDPQTLSSMTAIEVTPEMLAVMRDDAMRNFRVDVETDSTVAPDEQKDKRDVAEMFGAMGEFVGAIGPLVKEGALPKEGALSVMLWCLRKFKVSREIEDMLKQAIAAPPPEGGNDPAKQAEAQKMQAEMQALAAEEQRKAQESQMRLQMDQAEMQAEQARKDAEAQARIQLERQEFEREQRRKDALNQAKIQATQRSGSDAR